MTTTATLKPSKFRPDRVAEMIGASLGPVFRPSDDDDSPIGPWGPVIRGAFGLRHEVAAESPFARFGLAALNPQPLPPRIAFVAALGSAAALRAELIGEVAGRAGSGKAAARYLSELIDDWCGTPPRRFPWPWPGPRPEWARDTLGALDHLILAASLERAATARFDEALGDAIAAGRQRLVETALVVIQR